MAFLYSFSGLSLFFLLDLLIFEVYVSGECEVIAGCPDQGEYLRDVWKLYGIDQNSSVQDTNTCVYRLLRDPKECLESSDSSLQTNVMPSSPDAQWWSRCQHCGWSSTQGRFHIYNKTAPLNNERVIDLTASLWGEFFFESQNDFIQADVRDSRESIPPLL